MGELGIQVGMTVFDADGKRLGKVSSCDPWGFEVRRGFWSPYEWVIRYDEILELGPDGVKVARSDEALFELAAGRLPHAWKPIHPAEADEPLPATPAEYHAGLGELPERTPLPPSPTER